MEVVLSAGVSGPEKEDQLGGSQRRQNDERVAQRAASRGTRESRIRLLARRDDDQSLPTGGVW
ncbi:MAG TPA: hypothetical protein VEX18_11235, partial [Polyangiaceae bacterium]|nr:hypothetical protein [Polyangiaceae bacterium]